MSCGYAIPSLRQCCHHIAMCEKIQGLVGKQHAKTDQQASGGFLRASDIMMIVSASEG